MQIYTNFSKIICIARSLTNHNTQLLFYINSVIALFVSTINNKHHMCKICTYQETELLLY